jgi:ribonuclease J
LLFTVNQKTRKLLDEVNIISRGFIYMKESEKLVKEITETSQNAYKKIIEKRPDAKRQEIKKYIQETVDRHIHDKLNRQPLILPVFFEK